MLAKPLLCTLLLASASQVPAQDAVVEVALRDGRVLPARTIQVTSAGRWRLFQGDAPPVEVAPEDVLTVHGGIVQPNHLPAVHLAGGDVLRGLVVGGDAAGESLDLQSPVLGRRRVPIDRIDCIVFQSGVARARDLELPDGVDEALFQKAALGFDRVAGTLHQFGEQQVRFQPTGASEPRWYAARDLVGLRLRGGAARARPATAELVTRTGDRLGVVAQGFRDQQLLVQLEDGGSAALPLGDLGCLSLLGGGAVFLSSLDPAEVREVAEDGDVLLPWQRDASVTGAPLCAGGRTHGRGFGVHSKSRLVFTVPAGAAAFWTRVAFDDEVLRLPVRGAVDLRITLDDKPVFEATGYVAGEAVRSTGLLAVRPGQRLALEVDFGRGRDLGDRIDWLSPVFLPSPANGATPRR